jgi:hypothetical protein
LTRNNKLWESRADCSEADPKPDTQQPKAQIMTQNKIRMGLLPALFVLLLVPSFQSSWAGIEDVVEIAHSVAEGALAEVPPPERPLAGTSSLPPAGPVAPPPPTLLSAATATPAGQQLLADLNYSSVLSFLAQDTQVGMEMIHLDLVNWASHNALGLTVERLPEFLFHYYFVKPTIPYPDWFTEFHRLKVKARTDFCFDELGVFARTQPACIKMDGSGRRRVVEVPGATVFGGSFKKIFRVTRVGDTSGQEYALSQVRDTGLDDESEVYGVALNEAAVLRVIQSLSGGREPRGLVIPSFLAWSGKVSRILFLWPFWNVGDAHALRGLAHLSFDAQVQFAGDLLEGLRFLHHHRIVHRDIKPANVLLHQSHAGLHAGLTDFGTAYQDGVEWFAEMLEDEEHLVTTYRYLAPEAIEHYYLKNYREDPVARNAAWHGLNEEWGVQPDMPLRWNPSWSRFQSDQWSDLWSLGVTLLEVVTDGRLSALQWLAHRPQVENEQAWTFLTVNQLSVNAVLDQLEGEMFREAVSPRIIPVIRCLLRVMPEERCTLEQALEMLQEVPLAAAS